MAHLLLVDDQPQDLERLCGVLHYDGHVCDRARDGAEALKRYDAGHHDLVILDVLMPGMDGIKATRRLKQASKDEYVPVLLVTGLDEAEDRKAGLEAGADDFLTKPVEDWELRARVRAFLRIREQQRATEAAYRQLRELHNFRDELIELVVHDLKNPLAALSVNLDFVSRRLADDDRGSAAIADCRDSLARLLRMVTTLLDTNRLEEGRLRPELASQPARSLLALCIEGRMREARLREVRIDVVGDSKLVLRADGELLRRVFDNLLDNALRHVPRGGRIRLGCGPGPLGARLTIWNSGQLIPVADRERIFDKYTRADAPIPRGANHGIGLHFCRLAIGAHGGTIVATDDDGEGALFVIDLPA